MNRTELIALGEKLVKACLDYEKVDVGCWSVKGNGGLATEDCDIAIDIKNFYPEQAAELTHTFGFKDWWIETDPYSQHDVTQQRFKIII